MASANTVFSIQFGSYDLRLDRSDLTFSLVETATGTVWASRLAVGWVELEPVGRVDFGACRLVSLSEKMGATGKRILFGLDAPGGIPVDVYFTCGAKQIQLTVEASRDTREARVLGVGLLPGLVSTGPNGTLVLPVGFGGLLSAQESGLQGTLQNVQSGDAAVVETILDCAAPAGSIGLSSAFVGALRPGPDGRQSGLCVLHDSCYGAARVARKSDGWSASWEFARDPERRRLDLRVLAIPDADPVGLARAFRDHRVAERSHVTLRQKGRERPGALESVLSGDLAAPIDSSGNGQGAQSRWDVLDSVQDRAKELASDPDRPLLSEFPGEWTAAWVDAWPGFSATLPEPMKSAFGEAWREFPLLTTIWRDAVAVPMLVQDADDFSTALRGLTPPAPGSAEPWASLLRAVHRSTFAAFLTGHRSLGNDGMCEEWVWSNRTRVWINEGLDPVEVGDGRVVAGRSWAIDPPVEGVPSGGELPG
jgi:hypothetical protein